MTEELESKRKWGADVIDAGFCILPSILFRAQARLELTSTQLVLLLHLAEYWWQKEHMPFPSKATLGERMSLSPRQVQRTLAELEEAGFIRRHSRFASNYGQKSNEYDLTGLVEKLKKLAPEFAPKKEQQKPVATPEDRRQDDGKPMDYTAAILALPKRKKADYQGDGKRRNASQMSPGEKTYLAAMEWIADAKREAETGQKSQSPWL
jgi:hypothetical protein